LPLCCFYLFACLSACLPACPSISNRLFLLLYLFDTTFSLARSLDLWLAFQLTCQPAPPIRREIKSKKADRHIRIPQKTEADRKIQRRQQQQKRGKNNLSNSIFIGEIPEQQETRYMKDKKKKVSRSV